MKIMKFSYIDEFSCTGPDCIDSCCRNWRIMLTKREYLNYKELKCSPEIKGTINSAFKRCRSGGSDIQYARMNLKEDGSCPFLGEDRLCMLQKELGEEVLTIVCHTFPRLNMKVGADQCIITASVTCPHVTELLIAHPEGLRIEEKQYDGSDRFINKGMFTGDAVFPDWEGFPSLWLLKSTQVMILQDRRFTLSERLLILGYFSQKAEECIGDFKKMQTLSAAMSDEQLCRKIAGSLRVSSGDRQAAVGKLMDVIGQIAVLSENEELLDKQTGEQIKGLLEKIKFGVRRTFFDGRVKTSYVFDGEAVDKALEKYRALEEERSYIFENILVNHVFGERSDRGVWLNYFVLAVYYAMMKLFIPVLLSDDNSDSGLAQAVTDISKMLINTRIAERHIYDIFSKKGYSALPHLVFLLSE